MTPLDTAVQGLRAVLQQDYQRFLQLGSRRAPHNLHVHESGYRSGTINTDALGLRYSHHAGKRFSAAERGGVARINLLVGGSTAMGIGASSDEHTVASHLSMLTGEVWLSLAGCGLNASQELLLFLTHQHRLGEVGHVVLLSGLNTLAHEALGEVLAGPHDPHHAKAHLAYLAASTKACRLLARPGQRPCCDAWGRLSFHLARSPLRTGRCARLRSAWRAPPTRWAGPSASGTACWPTAMPPSRSSCNRCCPGAAKPCQPANRQC